MRSSLLDIQLAPNNPPTPSTTVIRMHIPPRNRFGRSQHHRQQQFCVPLVGTSGESYRMRHADHKKGGQTHAELANHPHSLDFSTGGTVDLSVFPA
jgi:hypothetical protein